MLPIPRRGLEAGRRRRADQPHPPPARRLGRPALLPGGRHQPAAPGLVRARAARRESVPALRDLEPRFADRARGLPLRGRAVRRRGRAGEACGRGSSRRSPCYARWRGARRAGELIEEAGDATAASVRTARFCCGSRFGHRIGPAPRGDQPPHPERRLGAAAVARAAHALPLTFIGLRGPQGLVPAESSGLSCWSGSSAWAGCSWSTTTSIDLRVQLGMFCQACSRRACSATASSTGCGPPRHLTKFYLIVSAGGALGGCARGGGGAACFDAYYELGIGMTVLALLAAVRFARSGAIPAGGPRGADGPRPARPTTGFRYHRDVRVSERGFYGVLRVKEYGSGRDLAPAPPGARHDHARRAVPARQERRTVHHHVLPGALGIGLAIKSSASRGRCASASSAWAPGPSPCTAGRATSTASTTSIRAWSRGQAGVHLPADSAAKIELALGDARLSLEREPPQGFDVLAVDAFSSDAIPVHLITKEALGSTSST